MAVHDCRTSYAQRRCYETDREDDVKSDSGSAFDLKVPEKERRDQCGGYVDDAGEYLAAEGQYMRLRFGAMECLPTSIGLLHGHVQFV